MQQFLILSNGSSNLSLGSKKSLDGTFLSLTIKALTTEYENDSRRPNVLNYLAVRQLLSGKPL